MAHETPQIQASRRQRLGTRYARRARRDGRLPAVVYGHGQDPIHVTVAADDFTHHLHEGARIVELRHDETSETCLIKDVQYDYLGDDIIHVDLARIDLNEEVTVTVSLEIRNREKSPGAKAPNAIVELIMAEVEVTCLASNIPEHIQIDIAAMELGAVVTAKDLNLPEGVTIDLDADEVILSIHETKEVEEEVVPEEGAADEPEVLTERKTKEGEETEDAKKE